MKSREEIFKNIIILLLLIIITFMAIFSHYDFKETIDLILSIDYRYIILSVFTMSLSLCFESLSINVVLSSLKQKIPFLTTLRYTLINRFYSGITPAATGGQPMEIYYMKQDGIPVSSSTLAILVQLCSFHIITVTIGIISAIINHKLLTGAFLWLFIIGLTLNLIATSILIVGLLSKRISNSLVNLFVKFLEKFKYKDINTFKDKITSTLNDYHEGSKFIKKHRDIFIKALLLVCLQVLMYYTVSYHVYQAFGLNSYSYLKLLSLSALLYVAVSSIPLPGTVGVSESAFLKINLAIYGKEILASAMILNRGVTFYFYMLISFLTVVYSTFRSKNNKKQFKN